MALTEQEKVWLEARKNLCERCNRSDYCRAGNRHGFNTESCRHWEPTAPKSRRLSVAYDWMDAAEFEARVAEKLVTNFCFKCPDKQGCSPELFEYPKKTIKSCRVMHARLAVEQEMDAV